MTEEEKNDKAWKKFLKNHWKFCLIIAAGIVGAVIGAVIVFLWRVGAAPAALGTPPNIGAWTVGYCVTFILNLILWEFLLIGIPIIAAAISIYALWYRKLPEDERAEYEKEEKKHHTRDGGGAVSFLVTITWLIIVWVTGYWNIAFSTWTFNYLISSWLWALLWDLIIFGIPIAIGAIWWLHRELKD